MSHSAYCSSARAITANKTSGSIDSPRAFRISEAWERECVITDEDNERFYLEEHERTQLETFELLALKSKAHAAMTHKMIELAVHIMNSLYTKYLADENESQ